MGRVDGTRVKDEVPMYSVIPHFMPKRMDSMNAITIDIPIDPMRQYMNEKRKEGRPVSHMAMVMTAYAHLVAEYPAINRFVMRRRIYQHNDIAVSLVVLRPDSTGNDDTISKLYFTPQDTVFDVQRKIDEYVENNALGGADNPLDKVMGSFVHLGWLMDIIGKLLWFMDRHGLFPKVLVDVSPFHASLLLTNLASIRTNHIYHHIYEFGTTSVSIAMGNPRDVPRRGKNGEIELVRCLPMGVVMDERVASGHYFALAFARFRDMLAHPEQLELPGETELDLSDSAEKQKDEDAS